MPTSILKVCFCFIRKQDCRNQKYMARRGANVVLAAYVIGSVPYTYVGRQKAKQFNKKLHLYTQWHNLLDKRSIY